MVGCVTYSTTVVPGGKNVNTRSVTVEDRAVVRKGSKIIINVSGTNSKDGGLSGGGVVGSILGLVTCGNSQEDASRDDASGGGVHGSGPAATKRQVSNSTVGAAAGPNVAGDVVDASNDTRVGTLGYSQLTVSLNARSGP